MTEATLSDYEKRLLDDFQKEFPLHPRPFAVIAERLGVDENTVLDLLCELQERGLISRVGAVVEPHRVGYSTLAAMRVPQEMLEAVGRFVASHPEVNHCYEREHGLNLWFVVAASSRRKVAEVLADIEYRTGLPVLDLPLEEAFRLDLGFPLTWE